MESREQGEKIEVEVEGLLAFGIWLNLHSYGGIKIFGACVYFNPVLPSRDGCCTNALV